MALGNMLAGAAGGATVSIFIKAYDEFSGTFSKANTAMTGLDKALRVGTVALGAVATGMVAFGFSATQAAMQSEVMSTQFKKLADDSDVFLERLNQATYNTVSDFDLMASANKALLLGLDQEALPEFFRKAAILGQASGRTVTEAVSDITLGVGRQSKLILDNLGIMVDAEKAYKDYADAHGLVADKMSDLEKKAAFLDATLKGMDKTINDSGMAFEMGFSQKLQTLKKDFADFKVDMGNKLIDPLTELFDTVMQNKDVIADFGEAMTIAAGGGIKLLSSGLFSLQQLTESATLSFGALTAVIKGNTDEASNYWDTAKMVFSGVPLQDALKATMPMPEGVKEPSERDDRLDELFGQTRSWAETVKQVSEDMTEPLFNNIEKLDTLAEHLSTNIDLENATTEQLKAFSEQTIKNKEEFAKLSDVEKEYVNQKMKQIQLTEKLNSVMERQTEIYGKADSSRGAKGRSNVEFDAASGTWVPTGKSEVQFSSTSKNASVVNNYYTQNNSAKTLKVTG